jgi:hypothetical protein
MLNRIFLAFHGWQKNILFLLLRADFKISRISQDGKLLKQLATSSLHSLLPCAVYTFSSGVI